MKEHNLTSIKRRIADIVTSGRGYHHSGEQDSPTSVPIYPLVFLAQDRLDQICCYDSENLFEKKPARVHFVSFVSTQLKDVSPEAVANLYSACLNYAATGSSLQTRVFVTEPNVKPHQLEDLDQFFGIIAEYLGNKVLGKPFIQKTKEAYDKRPKNWKPTNTARLSAQLTTRDKKVIFAQVTGEPTYIR